MSLAYHIARRLRYAPDLSAEGGAQRRVSRPAVRIATAGVAIGVAVMLLAVAIVTGFKAEVAGRLTAFSGHLTVQALTAGRTYETVPLCVDPGLIAIVGQGPGVTGVCPFVTKPAVVKTAADALSVVARGRATDGGGLALSETIARRLRLAVGDTVRLYFLQQDMSQSPLALGARQTGVRVRRLRVDSLFQTHLSEIDRQMVAVPAAVLQQVSGWDDDMYSGLEVHLDGMERMDEAFYALTDTISLRPDRRGTPAWVRPVTDQMPQLFAWLDLLDTNVWVILILIAAVAAFTTISGLLIIILERTSMIGVLKALGMADSQLRRVFLWVALFVVGRGLIWGNALGLALCYVQARWHVLRLDPENYYLEWVPIRLAAWHVAAIDAGCLALTLLVLLGPTAIVAKISPARTISAD